MSQENVEVVRAANEAFLGGDVAAALESLDPEIEWHGTVGGIDEGRVYHGREAVVQGFADYFEVWERIEMRAEEYIDAGDEVVVYHHEVAKGRESGVVVETDTGTVQTVRDGRIVRVRSFMDRAQALEAAGLRQ
ncbi:MAG: nuclear transport factor 2 family protein [Solirubrobacterales bacterium]